MRWQKRPDASHQQGSAFSFSCNTLMQFWGTQYTGAALRRAEHDQLLPDLHSKVLADSICIPYVLTGTCLLL